MLLRAEGNGIEDGWLGKGESFILIFNLLSNSHPIALFHLFWLLGLTRMASVAFLIAEEEEQEERARLDRLQRL